MITIYSVLFFVFCFFLLWNTTQICMSSLRRDHASRLCVVPVLVFVPLERAPQSAGFSVVNYGLVCQF